MTRKPFTIRGKGLKPRKVISAAGLSAILMIGQTTPIMANPTDGTVVAGSATIGAAGQTLTINQTSGSAIINWQQFSIPGGETTKFIVPSALSATLNRVTGGNPSAIYGNLQSNGILYLVNPSGIVVGPNGRIDTAGFMASTLDISNQQFLAGRDLHFTGDSKAGIDNQGTIHGSTGDVYLIANHVDNEGKITASQGTAGLAAGNDVLFQQAGSQHLFVQATPSGTKRATGVTNSGTIAAAAAELKAAGGNAYALAINNSGSIAATGYKKVGGQVYLTSEGGNITNTGHISAKTSSGNGGTILVDGTGAAGTGKVVNSGTLDASAKVAQGHGGTVTLKSKSGTAVNSGAILAKGGQGGVGGDVDVSGSHISLTGTVNTTALDGITGNFLLDPASLTVVGSGGTGTISSGTNSSDSTINASVVDNALATTNVTLQADNTIDVESALTWTSGSKLTLQTGASGSTTINATITAQSGSVAIASPTLTLNQSIIASTVSGTGVNTINVGSSTGISSSGRMVTDAVKIASAGATVNLHSGSTYALDTNTSGVTIDKNLTVVGNGATLDGQGLISTVLDITNGATVTVGNLTVANAYSYNVDVDYNNVTATFNNVTVTGSGGMGIYNYYTSTLNLNNCVISGNGTSTSNYTAGGIENLGTLVLDANTTVTGNSGLYTGGIYNAGTVTGNMTSTNIHGNTETYMNLLDSGADLFNVGTGTYVYKPDGEANNTYTITASIYSSGTGAVVTVDPSLTKLNVNAPLDIIDSATFNSSATTINVNAQTYTQSGVFNSAATTVNVAAGSGTENGFLVKGGVALAGSGGTVNLHAGTTYNFDNATSDLTIAKNVTVAGNGATINGQNVVSYLIDLETGATVTLNNLTVEGSTAYGVYNDYNNVTTTLNNVTISGNTGAGIYNYYTDTLNLNNCTITGNDGSSNYNSGGIYNAGTLNLDANTTVTGNTGYYTGGIFNSGTIVGNVTSTNVHDNTITSTDPSNSGTDFYNSGTGSFVYKPDGEANHTYTVAASIYSSGANAIVTVDPSLTTLNVNAEMNILYSAVFNGSATTINVNAPVRSSGGVFNSAATTVNVAAGTGTENGFLVQGGVAFAASGGTVNLHSGTTYDFDGTTGDLTIAKNVTLAGNNSILNGQNAVSYLFDLTLGANVTLNNLTVENSEAYGVYLDYNNVVATLNNVTVTANANSGIYNYYTDSLTLNNCTISNNGTSNYYYTSGGIYNAGTLHIDSATTVTGNMGYQAGGIYNAGTIIGTVTSTQVHGNTATYSDPTNLGADFYNDGTGTFEYKPDGEANNTLTITAPIYSSGSNAVVTIDPSLTTLNLNVPVNISANSVVNSSAITVNVAAGSGTNNGYMIQGAERLAANGGTVNLHSGTTYAFSGVTSGLTVDRSVTIAGNGAILNGNGDVSTVVDLATGVTATLNNLTVENGASYGVYLDYTNVTGTLSGVTVTGNAGEGIYNYYTDSLTLNNCTISGNGTANNYTAGGIYNSGTLHFDSSTTVTGNTGYQAGGIYNSGTIIGTVTNTQVHGNTATYTSPTNIGADFYNGGTGTFELKPDGEANNTLTVTSSIYSSGSSAVVTVDPTLTTLNLNAPVNIFSSSVVNSSATTVNVAAGSGTNNGYLIQGALALAASGGTVNLHSGTTYAFDDTTGGLTIAKSVSIAGNGAVLDGTNAVYTGLDITNGATVTLGNLTVKNDISYGVYVDYNNVTATLNNVSLTGITGEAIFNYYTNTLNINNSTINGNGSSSNGYTAGGIYNEGTLNLTNTTITGNTGYDAGGIYNSGTIIATDSSISGNTHTATSYGDDLTNFGTYTSITDASASTPNVFTYNTSDYNGGTAIYQAPTINWNKTFVNNGVLKIQSLGSTGAVNINNAISQSYYGSILVQAPTLNLNASISSGTGNIVLVASKQFVNNVGANALSTTNGYTWQVWSVNPPTSGQAVVDNDNGLTPAFIQTGATYGVTTPSGSGNGFFYSSGVMAGNGTLSGTAFTDGGVTHSVGVLIDLILNGAVLGSTTTDSSGNYSFSITTSNLSSGLLLTDATDHGNTYYQLNNPSATSYTSIDIWGSTLIVNANTVNNAALKAAAGSLSQNGINYLVTGSNLTTNPGINLVIPHAYQLDGNVTAGGTFTTTSGANLTGSTNTTLTGTAVNMGGTFAINGNVTVTSTTAPIVMELSEGGTATADSLALNSAQSITINNSAIQLNGGNFVATGDASAIGGDGVVILDTSINTEGGSYNITGTAGNFNGTAGMGIDIDNSSLATADVATDGSSAPLTGNITLTGNSNLGANLNTDNDLIGIGINHSVVTLINGAMTINGTVGSGATNSAARGIYLTDASVVTATGHGTVSLTGSTVGSTASSDSYGVDIDGASIISVANGTTGNLSGIHITGTAGNMANESEFANSGGIAVLNGSTVSGYGTAQVSLIGVGGADSDSSMEEDAASTGIFINAENGEQTSSVTTQSGALSLNGTAGASPRFSSGINMYGPNGGTALLSSTSGNITVTGSFPTTVIEGRELDGIIFQTGSEVTTGSGIITLNGSVNQGNADLTSTGMAHGVYLSGSAISASSTGSVEVAGDTTGAIGNYSLGGVLMQNTSISTGAGGISVTGTTSTTSTVGNSLYGANLGQSTSLNATGGNVSVTGTVGAGTAASKVTGVNLNSGSSISGSSVTLTGDTRGTTSLGIEAGVVAVNDGTQITANGSGGITMLGHAGNLANGATTIVDNTDNVTYEPVTVGVSVNDGATLTTMNSAPIVLTGFGGTNGSNFASTHGYVDPTTGATSGSHGVAIFSPGADTTTSLSAAGNLTIVGTAGSSPISGSGVVIGGASNAGQVSLTSASGTVSITGTGGAGNSTGSTLPNAGVALFNPGNNTGGVSIAATTGSIIVIGRGGAASTSVAINAAPYFNSVDNNSSNDPSLTAGTSIQLTSLAGDINAGGLAGEVTAPLTIVTTPAATLSTLSFGSNSGVVVLNGCDFVVTEYGGGVTFGASVVTNISIDQNVQEGETPGDTTLSSLTTRSLTITAAGNVNLNGAINAIHGPAGTTSMVNIQTTGGNIVLGPDGSITGSGVGNDVILAAGTNLANSRYFINNSTAGANAITVSNGAHSYIYSADPTYDSLGGLTVTPNNVIFNASYTTTGLPAADQQLFYVASGDQVGPNAPGGAPTPTPAPTTGSGSNIVPPQLTPNLPPITYVSGNLGNLGAAMPSPVNYAGNGASGYGGQQGGLADSSGNAGQVGPGDAAQLGGGQLNNVANPRASSALNQALGPAAYHNLASALADLGDWTDAGTSVPDGDSAGGDVQETVISAGDVVEVGGKGVKKVAPGQAPEQLKNALKGFDGGQ